MLIFNLSYRYKWAFNAVLYSIDGKFKKLHFLQVAKSNIVIKPACISNQTANLHTILKNIPKRLKVDAVLNSAAPTSLFPRIIQVICNYPIDTD